MQNLNDPAVCRRDHAAATRHAVGITMKEYHENRACQGEGGNIPASQYRHRSRQEDWDGDPGGGIAGQLQAASPKVCLISAAKSSIADNSSGRSMNTK